ncbi:MAG TPA: serine/threonine-protein kinase [Pirellulales bacterium]|nr:serine/threonine-protein kinase [Pirellulales bacterium]
MSSVSSSQRAPTIPVVGEGSSRARTALPGDPACDPDQPTVITQRPPGSLPVSPRATANADLARQLAGERLNHFQLLEFVGGGGMGAVFRALDTMLNREVALKVLSRDQGADDETRRRFQNEAQSAARLDHENIARVYYVGEDHGLNYIVFEFIEGTNLRDVVERKGPLPLAEALSYTLQIAHALDHAASRDVVHRDIKPSNVIVNAGGRAKLVDMGLARLHQVYPDGEDLTASGVTLGTFDYISPEQARDPRSADVRSDIYSLGCTLYYMLTGRPPFPDGTVLQKLLQHNSDAPPDPREFDASLPGGVSLLVAKMLAKDPLRRYQAAGELIADVLLLAEQTGCVLLGTERAGWPSATSAAQPMSLARQLPWLLPVSLLLLIAFASGWPLPWIDPPDDLAAVTRVQTRSQRSAKAKPGAASNKTVHVGQPEHAADASAVRQNGETADGADRPADNSASLAQSSDDADRASRPADSGAEKTADGRQATVKEPLSPGAHAAHVAERNDSQSDKASAGLTTSRAEDSTPLESLPEGLLVVGERLSGPRRYGSLTEACAAAKNGDVIELRYDGPREERPLALRNQRIEIRAGVGRRPALVFRPDDTDPIATDRTMCLVSGGSLSMSGVELELDLSQTAPSENWSLFTVDQADALRLEGASLTIRNATLSGAAYHDKVAFFRMGTGSGPGPMVIMPKSMLPLPPVHISLNNCVARGEADLLVDRDLTPVVFKCVNGLLAVSERLLAAGEGAAMPDEGVRVRIELDHVTALLRQGLCRIAASEAAPGMPEVDVRLTDSIVLSDSPDPALVEHVATTASSSLKPVFHWEAVDSVYFGFPTFWKIGLMSSRPVERKTFSEWTEFWPEEHGTRALPLTWRLRAPRQPLNAVTTADFDGERSLELLLPVAGPDDHPPGADVRLLPAPLVDGPTR